MLAGRSVRITAAEIAAVSMARVVEPEWLDTLPADAPRAMRSRRDLQRVNRLMATRSLLGGALDGLLQAQRQIRLIELGAGDGTLMLHLARRFGRHWPRIRLELLDLQPVVSRETLDAYRALGWEVEVIRTDVLDWLEPARNPAQNSAQAANSSLGSEPIIVFANLFVHHFDGPRLQQLLAGIAARAHGFVCLEPRRNAFAMQGSRALGLVGCNDVTRHDAVTSVRAGFRDREISAQWPHPEKWHLTEGAAGLFSHRFVASRRQADGH